MTLLQTEGLTKRFGGLVAVDHVDLGIERGETRAIIGPNGAGKSTCINLITGLLEPTEGTVTFDSEDITHLEPYETVQRGMAKSFQTASIFPSMTVEENVKIAAFAAEHGSFQLNFLRDREKFPAVNAVVDEMLGAVQLSDSRDLEVGSLPYGDKRRLEIAIALAAEPELLLMDEPTAGMSPEETQSTVDLVEDLQEELGLTIVLVEHDMEIIFRVADRITVLNRGSVIAEGSPDEVQGDPQVQEAYLGGVEL
ncbi:ABC transporter ATP-binding protein [Halobacteriales archaeon QS_4_70_19]|nr:MAG: ABC transporter ATP-binding protein [Halobacteriales archaeon QS_4_70_19]